jgi:DNA adenine methylase
VKPLLRWAGGKQRVVQALLAHLPKDLSERTYVEPFFGAGSLFFASRPRRALLADVNRELVETYRYVRRAPGPVAAHLQRFQAEDCDDFYYETRGRYNRGNWNPARAARFIYLNRTCFNGIYRVNKLGVFNVPYGYKPEPIFPSASEIKAASSALHSARIRHQCFRETLGALESDAFVYLDPPYPPLNGTSFFTHYTQDRFSDEDQVDLADTVHGLDADGGIFLMTNADTALVRRLYAGYRIERVSATRYITCKSEKHQVRELVIKNY